MVAYNNRRLHDDATVNKIFNSALSGKDNSIFSFNNAWNVRGSCRCCTSSEIPASRRHPSSETEKGRVFTIMTCHVRRRLFLTKQLSNSSDYIGIRRWIHFLKVIGLDDVNLYYLPRLNLASVFRIWKCFCLNLTVTFIVQIIPVFNSEIFIHFCTVLIARIMTEISGVIYFPGEKLLARRKRDCQNIRNRAMLR